MAYFFVTILSFYTNTLLARFHMLNGRRNIRFRDLARSGFGASVLLSSRTCSWKPCAEPVRNSRNLGRSSWSASCLAVPALPASDWKGLSSMCIPMHE